MRPIDVSPQERARRLGNVAAILIGLARRKQAAENMGLLCPIGHTAPTEGTVTEGSNE